MTFPVPLGAGLDDSHVHFVAQGTSGAPDCPGSAGSLAALPGHLCVYETHNASASFVIIFQQSNGLTTGSDPYGFGIFFTASSAEHAEDYGTWAVTAP